MKKDSEKRARVRFRVPTLVRHKSIPQSTSFRTANIRDISVIGIAFLADRAVPPGSVLELCFLDPEGEMLKTEGRVMHCELVTKNPNAFRVGVHFEKVPAEALDMLTKAEAFFLEEKRKKA